MSRCFPRSANRLAWPRASRTSFDRNSGWCLYGCGVRDDGRVINSSGMALVEGPEYGPEDQQYLFDLAQKGRP